MNYKKENIKYYDVTRSLYGEGDPRVLWKHKEYQLRRFERQVSLFDFSGKSILDIGCGYGDFYFYILEKGMQPSAYIGIDLVESHCNVARERLPADAIVFHGDFLESQLENSDISVLSGALNVHFENWQEVTLSIINKMWLLSTEAMTFNIRSSHGLIGHYKEKYQQEKDIDPGYWCKYAHERTSRYGLFHDYVNYDYTIAMWKATVKNANCIKRVNKTTEQLKKII